MNEEMQAVKDFGESLKPPSAHPPEELRRRVLTARPRPFARIGAKLAVGVAAAVAIGFPLLIHPGEPGAPPAAGPSPSQEAVSAAQLLAYAASYAETVPEPAVRPDQYVFTETVVVYQEIPLDGRKSSLGPKTVIRQWRSVDGREPTRIEFKLFDDAHAIWQVGPMWTLQSDPAALPADADAMYQLFYKKAEGDDGQALAEAAQALSVGQHSPAVQLAVFEAIERIPGVTVRSQATDVIGRSGIALVYSHGGSDTELVFDAKTYQYLGVNRQIGWLPDVSSVAKEQISLHIMAQEALVRVSIVDKVGDQ